MISSHHHHRKRKATAAEGGLLVANGGHFKNNTKHTASSSSASDGDYQLVQHEVLYSPLNNQYEVLGKFITAHTVRNLHLGEKLVKLLWFWTF